MRPYWQRNQDSKAWLRRWEEKRRRAFDGGQIDHSKDKSLTYWSVFGDVALMKNVSLHGEYAFDLDNQKDGFDDKAWTLALNYKY